MRQPMRNETLVGLAKSNTDLDQLRQTLGLLTEAVDELKGHRGARELTEAEDGQLEALLRDTSNLMQRLNTQVMSLDQKYRRELNALQVQLRKVRLYDMKVEGFYGVVSDIEIG